MTQPQPPDTGTLSRPPYRPPIGIPLRGEPRARATVASVLLHVLIILLVLAPTLVISRLAAPTPLGAGGAGPSGGGGGGNRGGGIPELKARERLRYLQLSIPQQKRPEPEPVKKPVEVKKLPPEVKQPEPAPIPPSVPAPMAVLDSISGAATGGTGTDGTSGTGPGRGGGVGSGVGTGRGSGNGPGTGGGSDTIYPPSVVALPILPLPIPSKVRPYRMVARFEVDTLGNAKLLDFSPSRDAGYNRRIKEMLLEIRFRPAVRLDGRPITAIAIVTAEAM